MEEEIEVWKNCGESGRCFYEVSNLGRIKSITKVNKKERILKQTPKSNGYLRVMINDKTTNIHNLIALVFIGQKPEGYEIDHIDRNKINNRADNLRYVIRSQNIRNRDDFRDDISEEDPIERKKLLKRLHARKYRENKKNIL